MHAQNRTAPRRAVHAYAYRRTMVLERRALATLATLAREEEEVPTARPLSDDRWERTPCSRKSEAADWDWDWDWDWKEG